MIKDYRKDESKTIIGGGEGSRSKEGQGKTSRRGIGVQVDGRCGHTVGSVICDMKIFMNYFPYMVR